ncbi:MAG: pectate lyase [Planctomycetota bacterium]
MKHIHATRCAPGLAWLAALLLATHAWAADEPIRWGSSLLNQDADWYNSAEARAVADSVIQYQSPQGGWPKNTDLAKPPRLSSGTAQIDKGLINTLDNGATTKPLRFLARVTHATNQATYRESFLRGIDYLLQAQYPNGGWPQFWPLKKGYSTHITYNDGAMINAMTVLRDTAEGKPPYTFIDEQRREKAAAAVERGVACILNTQIRQDGKPTGWCAQHNPRTLEPAWARSYEPPSIAGGATPDIVDFLMSIEEPSDDVVASIQGAVKWLESVQITGVRLERVRNDDGTADRRLVADPDAEPLWARFYELKTNRPLYVDRDSVFRYKYSELSHERRNGYGYLGTWPAALLNSDYPRWRKKHDLD